MKLLLSTLLTLVSSSMLFSQSTDSKQVSNIDCDNVTRQILRLDQQIESLDKRETFLKSKETIDDKQLRSIQERRDLVRSKKEEATQIQTEYCNPNNNSNNNDQAKKLEVKKIELTQEEFDALPKEKREALQKNPNSYEVINK